MDKVTGDLMGDLVARLEMLRSAKMRPEPLARRCPAFSVVHGPAQDRETFSAPLPELPRLRPSLRLVDGGS